MPVLKSLARIVLLWTQSPGESTAC